MSTTWEAAMKEYGQLVDSVLARGIFSRAASYCPHLAGFARPQAVLAHLRSDPDLDARDRVYGALAELAQSRGDSARIATALLWLGLEPGLRAVLRRHVRRSGATLDEAISDLADHFLTTVRDADLTRIRRVAATLVRNTKRNLAAARRGLEQELARQADRSIEDLPHESSEGRGARAPSVRSVIGIPTDLDDDAEIDAIETVLTKLVGPNAKIVVARVLRQRPLREIGAEMGLSYAAASKRYQRAQMKVCEAFRVGPMSQIATEDAFIQ